MYNAVLVMFHLANLLAAQKTTIYIATLAPRPFYAAAHREKTGCRFTSLGNQIAAKAAVSPRELSRKRANLQDVPRAGVSGHSKPADKLRVTIGH